MKRDITNSTFNSLDQYYDNGAYKHMKTLFDVSYAKFYNNYYAVYNTCLNKFYIIMHVKTLILRHLKYYTNFWKYHNKVL